MSGGLEVLAMKEDDVKKMLAASTHLGDANVHFQMSLYVYKTKSDGEWQHHHFSFTVSSDVALRVSTTYNHFIVFCGDRNSDIQPSQDLGEDLAGCQSHSCH